MHQRLAYNVTVSEAPYDKPTPIPESTAGLSLWYRLRWRVMYGLLMWGGPPHRSLHLDPRERMRRERAARVARAAGTTERR